MQLLCESGDIETAVAEFVNAMFTGERRDIELLKSKIAAARKAHKKTSIYQRELCELMAKQVMREVA